MSLLADPGFIACAAAVTAGACVQGVGGIGFAMLAAPVTALFYPELVPGPLLLLGGCASLLAALRELRHVDFRGAGLAFAGRVPGSIVAGLIIGILPRDTFAAVFAGLILLAVALSLTGWRVRTTPLALFTAGFSSGVMGTITSVGAPPMGIVMQNTAPAALRATVGAYLVGGATVSLAVLGWAGRFGWREFELGLLLIAPMALGFWLSNSLRHRVPAGGVRCLVLAISGASAALLLVKGG